MDNSTINIFYTGQNCGDHSFDVNQQSKTTTRIQPTTDEEMKTWVNDCVKQGDVASDPPVRKITETIDTRDASVIVNDCILCKCSRHHLKNKHENSMGTKVIKTLDKYTKSSTKGLFIATLCVFGLFMTFFMTPCVGCDVAIIELFTMVGIPILLVDAGFLALALLSSIVGASVSGVEKYQERTLQSSLNAASLVNPILCLMKKAAEEDEEFKKLLSDIGMTDEAIRKILKDTDTKHKISKLMILYKKLYEKQAQLKNISALNDKELSANIDPETAKQMIATKLEEIEIQKTQAEQKFNEGISGLLNSLINKICNHLATSVETQGNIKHSFLTYSSENKDAIEKTLASNFRSYVA